MRHLIVVLIVFTIVAAAPRTTLASEGILLHHYPEGGSVPAGCNTPPSRVYLQRAHDAGFTWARLFIRWPEVQPVQPDATHLPNWAAYDRQVAELTSLGFAIQAIVFETPQWAHEVTDTSCNTDPPADFHWNFPPANDTYFGNFVHEAALRYGTRIAAWELWHEVDSCYAWRAGPKKFRDRVLIPGFNAIKSVAPWALVGGPGIIDVSRLDDFIKENGQMVVPLDYLSVHNLGTPDNVKQSMNAMNTYMQHCTGQRCPHGFWLTAFGFSSWACGTAPAVSGPGEAAADIFKHCRNLGRCENAMMYTLHDEPNTPCDHGLLDRLGNPKGRYWTIQRCLLNGDC